MELNWLRKKSFMVEIRRFLHGFRIVQVKTEVSAEMGASPMLQRQSEHYQATGRNIIRITLIGYRKVGPVKALPKKGNEGGETKINSELKTKSESKIKRGK